MLLLLQIRVEKLRRFLVCLEQLAEIDLVLLQPLGHCAVYFLLGTRVYRCTWVAVSLLVAQDHGVVLLQLLLLHIHLLLPDHISLIHVRSINLLAR